MGQVVRGPLSTAKRAKGGSKKKNAGVGVDFKRIKHKVGKKLKKAQNETVTTFKSASVHIPAQQAMEDEKAGGAAVNFQNLSLPELLIQSGHYSDKTRKAALAGLADLLHRHPQELERHAGHAGQLLTKLAERVGDGESAVRQALRSLMRERVMPLLSAGAVRPFMPVVMAHVSSAMTNLCMEVRLDALSFLDVLMDFVPQLVSGIDGLSSLSSSSTSPSLSAAGGSLAAARGGFLAPCLQHFCDLLGQGHRGRSIKSQSIASLLKIIQSLNSFLKRAFEGVDSSSTENPALTPGKGDGAEEGPVLKTSKKKKQATSSVNPLKANDVDLPLVLMHERTQWPPQPPLNFLSSITPLWAASKGPNDPSAPPLRSPQPQQRAPPVQQGKKRPVPGVATPLAPDSSSPSPLSRSDTRSLAMRLVTILISQCWNECSPSVSSSNQSAPDLQQLQALSGILSATSSLVTRLIRVDGSSGEGGEGKGDKSLKWLADLALPRMTPCFPATIPVVKPNHAISDALVAYNIQCSQLLAATLPAASSSSFQSGPLSSPLSSPNPGLGGSSKEAHRTSIPPWVHVLVHYYIGVMERSDLVPARSNSILSESSSLAAGSATNAAHLAALRGIEVALFSSPKGDEAAMTIEWVDRVSSAVEALTVRVSSRSPVKLACLRLQHRIMEASRQDLFALEGSKLAAWLTPLPKLVWELSSLDTSSATIEVALRMMLDAARFPSSLRSVDSNLSSPYVEISMMQKQLAPLFCVFMPGDQKAKSHPAAVNVHSHSCPKCREAEIEAVGRVNAAKQGSMGPHSIIPGPYSKLPPHLQSLAADLIYHIELNEPILLKAIAAAAIESDVLPDDSAALRLVEAALSPIAAPNLAVSDNQGGSEASDGLEVQASLAVTLLFALPQSSPASSGMADESRKESSWRRHQALVDRVCLSLAQSSPPLSLSDKIKTLAEAMMPAIEGSVLIGGVKGLIAPRQTYGLIRLCTFVAEEEGKERERERKSDDSISAWIPDKIHAILPSTCLSFYLGQTRSLPPLPPSASFLQQAARSSLIESNASEASEVVISLIRSRPSLLLTLIKLVAQESLQDEKGHSETCFLETCSSSVGLVQRLMESKGLQPLLLKEGEAVKVAVGSLLSSAKDLAKKLRAKNQKGGDRDALIDELSDMATKLEQRSIDLGLQVK